MRRGAGLVAILTLAASPAWAAVAGRVVDGQGAPVAGAAVTAFAPETADQRAERLYRGGERTPLGRARSGADGTFRIEGDSPVLDLLASAEGCAPAFARALPETTTVLELKPASLLRGIVTAGGKAVGGARVVLLGGADVLGEWSARTAADGSYQVPDPGTWASQIIVLHPDYAPLDSPDARDPKSALDQQLDAGVTLEGTVSDESGLPVPGATLWVTGALSWPLGRTGGDGVFRLAHAPRSWRLLRARTRELTGSLSRQAGRLPVIVRPGRLLTGTVRDGATGQPLAGATVSVSGRNAGYDFALTDSAGRYRFEGLGPARYQTLAARAGYTQMAPGGLDESVDLRVAPQGRRDIALRRKPAVSGRVVDEAGRPLAGALVALGIKGAPHIYASDPQGLLGEGEDAARTASDGSFALTLDDENERLPEMLKDRPLIVMKRGYAGGRADIKGRGAAGAEPLRITLTRGIELSGRVRSPEGAPLPGVAVTLAEDGTVYGTMIPSHFVIANLKTDGWATTDAAGRFQVRVHPAVHHLAFRGAGVAPHLVRGYDPRSGQALEVVLEPAATLRGRVVRPDGRAVADVAVSVSQPSTMNEEAATTGPDGRFEVRDLARGLYELTAVHDTLGIHETRMVEVPAADWQLVLEASRTLRGRVVDAATREAVKGFHVFVLWGEEPGRKAGSRQVDVEDASGAFELADVPARDVSLRVSAAGYAPRKAEVAVTGGGEAAEVEVALEADAPIRGRVTAEDKGVVPEAMVRVVSKGDGDAGAVMVDERGDYELRGVAPGEVRLAFQAKGFLTESRTLDTRQTTRLDVALRRGRALSGVVVSEGAAVPGAAVSASSSALNAEYVSVRSDAQGRFKLEGLVAGRYSITGSADGKGTVKLEDVDPETAGTLRLVLERPALGTLNGKVVGLAVSDEVVYAEVKASNENGESESAMVDGAGTFRMPDAPAGHLTVSAEAATQLTTRQSRRVELTLAPGAEAEVVLEFSSTAITGQVTRDGQPVPGLAVSFDGTGLPAARGRTDARGTYEVAGLESGRYEVTVSGDGSSFETEYVVSGSGEFDIDITGGAVQGSAVRADGGTPLPGVEVLLWPLGARDNRPDRSATTNGQGEFALRSLREGRYRLTTSKAGFGQQVREVEVSRGAAASVLLELSPAAGVSVSVVDARQGRALEATVVVRDLGRRIVANSHSGADEEGVVNIPLADGPYLLSTSATGYGTATVPVTAPSEGLRVGLTPGGTLVIESARDLREKARLIQPDGEEYVQCWCNGIAEIQLQGRRTTVEHVTPGSYTLELLEGDEVVARKPAVVREGQTTAVTIDD